MEDGLNIFENARQPYFYKLKTTSMFFFKRKRTSIYLIKEDKLKKKKQKQYILPGNLNNTTIKSKLAHFKQKMNLNWMLHNSKLT